MNAKNLLTLIPSIEPAEFSYLQGLTENLDETQMQNFVRLYNEKRQTANTILLTTLIGFLGFAGIQRFLIGDILMGILYLFTGGFCGIGTIIDAVNHRSMANNHNVRMANETYQLVTSLR